MFLKNQQKVFFFVFFFLISPEQKQQQLVINKILSIGDYGETKTISQSQKCVLAF